MLFWLDANFDEDVFFFVFFWTWISIYFMTRQKMLAQENKKLCVRILINVASSFWEAQLLVCRCLAKSSVLEGII